MLRRWLTLAVAVGFDNYHIAQRYRKVHQAFYEDLSSEDQSKLHPEQLGFSLDATARTADAFTSPPTAPRVRKPYKHHPRISKELYDEMIRMSGLSDTDRGHLKQGLTGKVEEAAKEANMTRIEWQNHLQIDRRTSGKRISKKPCRLSEDGVIDLSLIFS